MFEQLLTSIAATYSPHSRYLVPLGLVLFALRFHLLTSSGCLSALFVGILITEAGWGPAGMLITFFLLGSGFTKVKQHEKEAAMPYPESDEEATRRKAVASGAAAESQGKSTKKVKKGRDMWQVFATGLIPALICALRHAFPEYDVPASMNGSDTTWLRPYWYLTYLSYVACCCGDTLASEIGMLSKQQPIMLWHKKRVTRGVDGGMTLLGTFASAVGGACIGAFGGSLYDVLLGAVYGCIGSLFDSIMGTFMQSTQYLAQASKSSSKDSEGFVQDKADQQKALPLTPSAWKQLNNVVNVLSSIVTSILAIAVQYLALYHSFDLLPLLGFISLLLLLTVTPKLSPVVTVVAASFLAVVFAILFGSSSTIVVLGVYVVWRLF